uniref:Lipocalin n=1 Tax=Rhipicephalus appendiculatus TaxID=34631 RepID=A0A131YHW1_RHIAP
MARSSLLCPVLSVLFLIAAAGRREEQANYEVDIVRFWNTTEYIWTTHTTASTRRACKVDMKEHITETNITFNRSYVEKVLNLNQWIIRRYDGVFLNFGHYENKIETLYNAVDITERDRLGRTNKRKRDSAREVLHYQSTDNMCAVFLVFGESEYSWELWYDIRIKDSYLKRGFSKETECWEKFAQAAAHRKIRPAYHPKCHVELDRIYPNPLIAWKHRQ